MDLNIAIIVFVVGTIIIVFAGTALTRNADKLADKTGLGEAFIGAIFLGAVTSIAGIITSITAAYNDHPELAISNAIGGIAAQTVFLCIADITYRKVNLEHAAASYENLMQGILLLGLLILVILGIIRPDFSIFNIHPISFVIFLVYIIGNRMISLAKDKPMWNPRKTISTVKDEPEEDQIKENSLTQLILKFIGLSAIVGACGYAIAVSGINISDSTNLSEGFVGFIFTAIATSTPELIVTLAAVRQKALTLAVANIIGGNSFDVLFVAFSDAAYQDGSIFKSISQDQSFIVGITMLMVAILMMGLLHRQRKGFANIGWESALIIFTYIFGNIILFVF